VIASDVAATVGEVPSFASGREFAAFLGLAPRRGRAAAKSAWGASRKC
jgi:transposase